MNNSVKRTQGPQVRLQTLEKYWCQTGETAEQLKALIPLPEHLPPFPGYGWVHTAPSTATCHLRLDSKYPFVLSDQVQSFGWTAAINATGLI
ncbi:hypothetical protein STEG23_034710 [Scotinomys teguina]